MRGSRFRGVLQKVETKAAPERRLLATEWKGGLHTKKIHLGGYREKGRVETGRYRLPSDSKGRSWRRRLQVMGVRLNG